MTYGACVSGGEKLATEDMNASTAKNDTKLSSCPCRDPTCPKGHGSNLCGVRMPNYCQICKAHNDAKPRK